MAQRSMTFIANWKMYLPHKQAQQWFAQHLATVTKSLEPEDLLVICPSFEALETTQKVLNGTHIRWGAQDCSEHENGAHTGQVSAQSLAELGCSHAIVGHSETAIQDAGALARKVECLIEHRITPVICIGETFEQRQAGTYETEILGKLATILQIASNSHAHVLVAYEPVWAIGTGTTPTTDDIAHIGARVKLIAQNAGVSCSYLYGGSINTTNVSQIKKIGCLDGLLIGRASTDADQLAAIMSTQ